jgi:hypothetical protein
MAKNLFAAIAGLMKGAHSERLIEAFPGRVFVETWLRWLVILRDEDPALHLGLLAPVPPHCDQFVGD